MYYSFLIHSSAYGHLGCFQVLAIINSAVMNIAPHISCHMALCVFNRNLPQIESPSYFDSF